MKEGKSSWKEAKWCYWINPVLAVPAILSFPTLCYNTVVCYAISSIHNTLSFILFRIACNAISIVLCQDYRRNVSFMCRLKACTASSKTGNIIATTTAKTPHRCRSSSFWSMNAIESTSLISAHGSIAWNAQKMSTVQAQQGSEHASNRLVICM